MRDFVISVVDFFAWIAIIACTIAGFSMMRGTMEYFGALIGFFAGCMIAGGWFVLSSIHDNIQALRKLAENKFGENACAEQNNGEVKNAKDSGAAWTEAPVTQDK